MTVSGILFSAKIAPKTNFKENNPSRLRHIAMPKRSSPRKMNRRNRRRIYCSKCGSSYSYSGSRTHVCMGDSNDEINNPDHDEMDSPPAQPFSRDDISLDDEPETEVPINCHDSDENIEETDTKAILTQVESRLCARKREMNGLFSWSGYCRWMLSFPCVTQSRKRS